MKKISFLKKMILLDLFYYHPTNANTVKSYKTNQQQLLSLEMTTTTQLIVIEFTTLIDTEKEYTRNELGKILTEVFHQINSGKKASKKQKTDDTTKVKKTKKTKSSEESSEPKKKREPTDYNIFVKENMSVVKEEFPELSRQDLMRKVGERWKASKTSKQETTE